MPAQAALCSTPVWPSGGGGRCRDAGTTHVHIIAHHRTAHTSTHLFGMPVLCSGCTIGGSPSLRRCSLAPTCHPSGVQTYMRACACESIDTHAFAIPGAVCLRRMDSKAGSTSKCAGLYTYTCTYIKCMSHAHSTTAPQVLGMEDVVNGVAAAMGDRGVLGLLDQQVTHMRTCEHT
jgi:hypothetical protein